MFFKNSRKGSNQWFLYIAMLLALIIGTQIGGIPRIIAQLSAIENNPDLGTEHLDSFNENPDFSVFDIGSNLGFLYVLLPFIMGFIVFYYAFPLLHKRPFNSLISWTEKVDWSRIFFGFSLWIVFGMLIHASMYFRYPEIYSFQFKAITFFPLLLMSLLLLPIQTSLEEFVFRSYLLQGFGNMDLGLSRNMTIIGAWILTSLLFGFVHISNPEVQNQGVTIMMVYYIGAGLFLGMLTIWDNRLELALGVHAATNFISAVLVGYEGAAIQTDSIFNISEIDVIHATIGFYVFAIVFIIICKSKYKWGSFLNTNNNELKTQV